MNTKTFKRIITIVELVLIGIIFLCFAGTCLNIDPIKGLDLDNMKYDGDLVNEYCFSKTEKRFDDLIKYVEEHANGISIGMMVDSVDSDGNSMYIRSIDNRTYEVLKFIDNKKEIHEIIEILKKAKYERLSNLMGYSILFQIYENDKLLLEFDRGQIKTKDDYIYVYFENSDAELLKSYYK